MVVMSEASNGLPMVESTSSDDQNVKNMDIDKLKSAGSEAVDKMSEVTEVDDAVKPCASSMNKESVQAEKGKSKSVDFVLISDDEGDGPDNSTAAINGNCSPNGIQSVESDDSDELGVIEEDVEDESGDNADDEIEITGVSMAHNEYGTVGGMDQLLRTLIDQGWTEAEIMRQLRGMIAPYQGRQRLNNFNTISDVVDCIERVNKVIIVSGAGISVSCGIPDFRSETGLYARLSREYPTLPNPTAMFDLNYFLDDPNPFFTFAKEIWPGQFKPSPCHRFIKLLESHGKLLRNYTQNIDTLEQVAGIERVIQCHGSFATASCIYCQYQVPGDNIKSDIMEGRAPICPKCTELSLAGGRKTYLEFAKSKYREIKKKLRRREKFSSSSSSSVSSRCSTPEVINSSRSRQNGKPIETRSTSESARDVVNATAKDKTEDSAELQPSSSKHCASTSGATDENNISSVTQENNAHSESKDPSELERSLPCSSQTEKSSDAPEDVNSHVESTEGLSKRKSSLNKNEEFVGSPSNISCTPLEPLLKPDIVFFGEDLPRNFFDHAEEDLEQAELIIVIGSSMKVKPVASIPDFVQERTPRVLINREPVKHISFDVQLLGDADEIVQQLCYMLRWESPVDANSPEKIRPHRPTVTPLEELSPLPTRTEVEELSDSNKKHDVSEQSSSCDKGNDKEPTKKKEKGKEGIEDKVEFEKPCPLFGSRCQCPTTWNIAQYLPNDTIVKMQPNTFIFPGANVMHHNHVITTSGDLYPVESDSDLGGYENPIEVSSSEGSVCMDKDHVQELSDAEDDEVSPSSSTERPSKKKNGQTTVSDTACPSNAASDSKKSEEAPFSAVASSNSSETQPVESECAQNDNFKDISTENEPCESTEPVKSGETLKRPFDTQNKSSDIIRAKVPRLTDACVDSVISTTETSVTDNAGDKREVPKNDDP